MVAPWRAPDRLLGYVEMGIDISNLTAVLRDALDLHAFVVLRKDVVSRAAWEAEMRALGRPAEWDRYPAVVLVDGTLRMPPRDLEERFAAMTEPGGAAVVSARLMGRPHQGQVFPLVEAGGRTLGEIVYLRDRSSLLAAFNRGAIGFTGVFLLVALALWIGLRRTIARHFVRPLQELLRVTEAAGRGDLAETLLAQRHDEMGDLGRAVNRLIGELRAVQEERTRKILDSAHDAVVTADASGVILGWNPAAETIFG